MSESANESNDAIEVRGTVNAAKYKAAKALGGEDTVFELRAMKPARGAAAGQITCIVCLICVVCAAAAPTG
ncbi:hypothetical protein ABZ851_00235 [Streptomyces sp. NPDC047049]|uniref:hypothetical protein n=1 Tax=Streptomyces sp. NPDC047049 TaxID=3156688 RepID=UPI0033D5A7F2